MRDRNSLPVWPIALGLGWVFAVGTGLALLQRYDSTPGAAAVAPEHWPSDSRVQPVAGRATLIMLAHPRCPCTRASIGELARLIAQVQGTKTDAYVLFLRPDGSDDDWERTDLWRSAAEIPGVQVVTDEGGREARRFGSLTSGETLLYDGDGRLVFSGGITDGRGHSGDNTGRSALVALLTGTAPEQITAPVFGCPLIENGNVCDARTADCPG
jgi:hypothetical protein